MAAQLQRGFTLLEVLAALTITAVAVAAVAELITRSVWVAGSLEKRAIATWVASNELAELRVAGRIPGIGESEKTVSMAGHSWHVRQVVRGTADPAVRRVDMEVRQHREDDSAIRGLFGYLGIPPIETGNP